MVSSPGESRQILPRIERLTGSIPFRFGMFFALLQTPFQTPEVLRSKPSLAISNLTAIIAVSGGKTSAFAKDWGLSSEKTSEKAKRLFRSSFLVKQGAGSRISFPRNGFRSGEQDAALESVQEWMQFDQDLCGSSFLTVPSEALIRASSSASIPISASSPTSHFCCLSWLASRQNRSTDLFESI